MSGNKFLRGDGCDGNAGRGLFKFYLRSHRESFLLGPRKGTAS